MFGMSSGTLIAVGVAIVVTAGSVWFVYHKGESAGAANVTTQVQQNTINTQRKMDDAQSNSPRTPRDVSKLLRDHKF